MVTYFDLNLSGMVGGYDPSALRGAGAFHFLLQKFPELPKVLRYVTESSCTAGKEEKEKKATFNLNFPCRQEVINGAPPIDSARAFSSAPTVNKSTFVRWAKRAPERGFGKH